MISDARRTSEKVVNSSHFVNVFLLNSLFASSLHSIFSSHTIFLSNSSSDSISLESVVLLSSISLESPILESLIFESKL